MKKISNIFVVLLLMLSLSSLAMADGEPGQNPVGGNQSEGGQDGENETSEGNNTDYPDSNETYVPDGQELADPGENETTEKDDNLDNKTEEEIGIMNSTLGSEIRLLQLEKAIMKNILIGERSVEVLKELEYNTSDLESILKEMMFLLDEVQIADPSSNDSVKIFVDLKRHAKNFTRQFRETIKELLDDEKINQVKQRVREIAGDELENYTNRIRNRIIQFNRNQLNRFYSIIGRANNSLIEDYENGIVSLSQLKSQLSKGVNQMTRDKKFQVFSEVKEENIKEKINGKAFVENIRNNDKGKGKGGRQ